MSVPAVDIDANVRAYLGYRTRDARYSSFDYCFNYFQNFGAAHAQLLTAPDRLEVSCLQLGFYLASWGMLRGRSVLLQRSVRYYAPVIHAIANTDSRAWETDVDQYDDVSTARLLETAREIRSAFPHPVRDVLITKIMLGVFGSVPAYDRFFRVGFQVSTFGRKSLRKLADFYRGNRDAVDRHRVPTLDFASGNQTQLRYSRAKVIDMTFFIEGQRTAGPPSEQESKLERS